MIAQGLSRPSALWVHFFELIPPACVGFVCGAWYLCDLQPPQVVAGCGLQCNLRYAYAMIMHYTQAWTTNKFLLRLALTSNRKRHPLTFNGSPRSEWWQRDHSYVVLSELGKSCNFTPFPPVLLVSKHESRVLLLRPLFCKVRLHLVRWLAQVASHADVFEFRQIFI